MAIAIGAADSVDPGPEVVGIRRLGRRGFVRVARLRPGRRRRRQKKARRRRFFFFDHYVISLKRDLCIHWTLLTLKDAFLDVEENTRFQYEIWLIT